MYIKLGVRPLNNQIKIIVLMTLTSFIGVNLWGQSVVKRKDLMELPVRELSIIATNEGYYPKEISVFIGEKLRLFLTSTVRERGSCLILPQKKVFLSARMGKVSEAEIMFDRSGVYKFYCPAGKIFGNITVIQKKDYRKENERSIASKVFDYWMPRDE